MLKWRGGRKVDHLLCAPPELQRLLRYTINSKKLHASGWVEEMGWEEGLKINIDWYKKYTSRYGYVDGALVACPRTLDG
jgi:hypothetical protein